MSLYNSQEGTVIRECHDLDGAVVDATVFEEDRLSRTKVTRSGREVVCTTIETLDSFGCVVRRDVLENGQKSADAYTYDGQHRVTSHLHYQGDDVAYKVDFKYNENTNDYTSVMYDRFGIAIGETRVSFEYDNWGNWIREHTSTFVPGGMTVIESSEEVRRVITYFEKPLE